MCTDIIAAIIESCGVIVAALIAAIGARKIVKDSVNSRFRAYTDKTHDVADFLAHSQNDVFIVVMVGNKFLKKYKNTLIKLLNRGIHIRYLLLTERKLKDAERYMNGEDVDIAFRRNVLTDISELNKKYKGLFEYREFDSNMTASYICTDIMPFPPDTQFSASAAIQIMLYQYKTPAGASPITYISAKTDEKEFTTTVNCIKQMWNDARS